MERPPRLSLELDDDQVIDVADNLSPRYKLGRCLGKGRYGIVLEAFDKKSGENVAIKSLDRLMGSNINQEITILKRVQHPNCIRLKKVEETSTCTYLVMDLCSGGDLFEKNKRNGPLPEASARKIALKLFEAVAHLHRNEIMHRGKRCLRFFFRLV